MIHMPRLLSVILIICTFVFMQIGVIFSIASNDLSIKIKQIINVSSQLIILKSDGTVLCCTSKNPIVIRLNDIV